MAEKTLAGKRPSGKKTGGEKTGHGFLPLREISLHHETSGLLYNYVRWTVNDDYTAGKKYF